MLKPKDLVRRILTGYGLVDPGKQAYWLGLHMECFVNHTRKHGELFAPSTACFRASVLPRFRDLLGEMVDQCSTSKRWKIDRQRLRVMN